MPTSDGDEGGCTGGSGGGGCSSNPGGGGLGYSYQKYKSVPESTSTLGMLVLSAWAIVKTLKLRKTNNSEAPVHSAVFPQHHSYQPI